jgi:lipid II:glycine glycyltransferase (peptidoglycan interpeptide bridge formation enzyme)
VGDLWKRLSSSARNAVRQAKQHGLELEEASESELQKYFQLYKSTMRRRAAYRMGDDWQFYDTMYSLLFGTQRMKILLARYEGVTIAGLLLLAFNGKGYWLSGGSLTEFWQYRPNEFLLWNAYEWAHQHGISNINLGGARVDNGDGLHLFKRHMGGEQVNMLRLTIPINRLRNSLATNIIRSYQKIKPVIPDFVTSALRRKVWSE